MDKIREAKTICSVFAVLWQCYAYQLSVASGERQKSNFIVEWWLSAVDHFCLYVASHFPLAVPAAHLNSPKSYLGSINFDKPAKPVALSFV